MTRIVRVDHNRLDEQLREAVEILRRGGLVVFPTETVYGLGADAYIPEAVEKIFRVKGRPQDNPLIVHISSMDMLGRVAREIPVDAYRAAEKLWPGPFTMVLPRGDVPPIVSAGLDTVAVRMPGHRVALRLIELLGDPIAAPSANRSGRPSPTSAQHVVEDLYGLVDLILDDGETLYGVESTVVDFTTDPPTLLRPGPLTPEELMEILGTELEIPGYARGLTHTGVARSPGVKYRHYSPRAEVVLIEMEDYRDLDRLVGRVLEEFNRLRGRRVVILATDETRDRYLGLGVPVLSLGSRGDPYTIAKNLFAMLREADRLGAEVVLVEGVEERGLGLTIMNRLRKAASRRVST